MWCWNTDMSTSTEFGHSEQQIMVWDTKNMRNPLTILDIDTSSGTLMLFCDMIRGFFCSNDLELNSSTKKSCCSNIDICFYFDSPKCLINSSHTGKEVETFKQYCNAVSRSESKYFCDFNLAATEEVFPFCMAFNNLAQSFTARTTSYVRVGDTAGSTPFVE